jgi:hypothetical protein
MTRKLLTNLSIVAVITIIGFGISCKKEEIKTDTDTQSAEDNQQAELVSDDAVRKADAATKGQSSFKLSSDADMQLACATVTVDSQAVITTTIDFGTTNCLCTDNRYRRGKIISAYSGYYYAAGNVRTITFQDYYVNDHKIEGTHTVTFNGRDATHPNYTWTISAQNMKITAPDGKSHTWSSTRTRELIAGANTLFDFTDDVYEITGSANGTNRKSISYSVNIDKALTVKTTCQYIVSGRMTIKADGVSDRVVDFGLGDCDNKAEVVINGHVYPITLN